MKSFAWALIGPGPIAGRFTEAVQRMDGCHLAWVHGRDLSRSTDFASRWSVADKPPVQAAAQLDELLANPAVDAVYIATPHAFHADAIRRCLLAGKPVLCEKPLVPNLLVAQELVELAQTRQVFLMEALWTHFLPIYAEVGDWLAQGRIGELRGMQSSFCFSRPFDAASRLFDPAQAGGAHNGTDVSILSEDSSCSKALKGNDEHGRHRIVSILSEDSSCSKVGGPPTSTASPARFNPQ